MIKSIDAKIDVVEIHFDSRYSGIFSCFGEEVTLKNSDSISLEYNDSIVYNSNFRFKPDGGDDVAIIYNGIDFLDIFPIMNGVKSSDILSPETVFFITRNISNYHEDLMRRCNAAIIMSYRAIELDREDLVSYSLGLINTLLTDLNPNRDQSNLLRSFQGKSNPVHVLISLQYVKSMLSLYICDEKSFVDSLNASLQISRETNDKTYLPTAYFSLVLVHKLVAIYVGKDLSFLIYDESFYLSRDSYNELDVNLGRIRLFEVSVTISQLSELGAFSKDDELGEKDFFTSALRCTHRNKLYSNFKKFKQTMMVNLKPLSDINNKTLEIIKHKAAQLEKEGDIRSALELIKSALMAKPNGPLIRKKYLQYKKMTRLH